MKEATTTKINTGTATSLVVTKFRILSATIIPTTPLPNNIDILKASTIKAKIIFPAFV